MSDDQGIGPVTDAERKQIADCASLAQYGDDNVRALLGVSNAEHVTAIIAREAITGGDLTLTDVAWLFAHTAVRLVGLAAELEEAHEAFDVVEAKRLEHEQTIADLRAQLAQPPNLADLQALRHQSEQLNTIAYAMAGLLGKVTSPRPYHGDVMELWRELANRYGMVSDLREQLDASRAEVEHLKVERGEALTWSPWNDHEVLYEQWAKRRAAGGLDVTHRCGACGSGVHWSTRRQWEHITPAADGHTPACGTTGPGGVTCSAQPSHGLAHWAGGVRTTTWTDRDQPTAEACGSHSGRYPNPDGVYCTREPGHDGPHRTRRDEHEWTWSQTRPGASSLHGRHMCGVVDFVSEVRCGRTRGHDGEHAVDEPPVQRASGGLVPSGQTVTIGPAEPPPLPKRVKGTHGPGDRIKVMCAMCGKPMATATGACSNIGRCPQAVTR